jgi:exodeoxyribonuclease VII large subunit
MSGSLIEDGPEGVNIPEFSVTEISGAVKRLIEGEFGHVRVRGEIGRVSRPRSGHVYLDLKDERSVLAGVVWRGTAGRLEIEPQEGDEVIATGRLTTFAGQSKYQLVIESLAYAGEGALLAKLERLRKALAAEGLFAEERKRAIPFLPGAIGVVTSPSGAVIRDILHRLGERFPVRVLVWPVAVQGAACAPEVAAAIRGFGALARGGAVPRPDVLIVARGGGSIEDLWGFNEEIVVRAAAESPIPLISAVGHETDTTLIDFAADRRAPTPTAAAELAVPVRAELMATVADLEARRAGAMARGIGLRRQRLADLARALPRPAELVETRQQRLDWLVARLPRPADLVEARRQRVALLAARLPRSRDLVGARRERLGHLAFRLPRALQRATDARRGALGRVAPRFAPRLLEGRIAALSERLGARAGRLGPAAERAVSARRDRLAALARLLGTLGYRQTLARGYAVVRGEGDAVLTQAAALAPGDRLEIEFSDGRVPAVAGEGGGGAGRAGRGRRPGGAPPEGQGRLF